LTYLAAGAGALGTGLVLLSRSRSTLLVGFLLLGVAEAALLAGQGAGTSLIALVSASSGLVAFGAGLLAIAAVAAVLVRYPLAVAPLALVAAPLRPPLAFGGEGFPVGFASGELGRLLPLYALLMAAVVALAWRVARGAPVRELPRALAGPAALLLALVVASLLWSRDPAAAGDQVAFFWLPFAALVAVVARQPIDDPRLGRLLAAAVVVPGAIFAAVGIWQAATGVLFFSSPRLEAGNAYGSLFRVTSLFDDPSHYGRHLVLAIVIVLVVLWLARVRLAPAVALLALLGTGLYFSYSQSSMVALVVAAVALALVAGERRSRRLVMVVSSVVAVAGLGLFAYQLGQDDGRSVTSGRSPLIESTLTVFAEHPVVGVGVAGQPAASRELAGRRRAERRYASHTTPLTVAAELGALGLAAYLALVAGAAYTLARVRRRDPLLGLGLAAALLALFVHSLFYDGFFDNPITWIALAISAAAGAAPEPADRRAAAPRQPTIGPAPSAAASASREPTIARS
jgi:O-antigen ligase